MGYNIGFNIKNKTSVQSVDLMIHKGDIYLAEMKGFGSIQDGTRPVVIVQNDLGNKFSSTTIVVSITSQEKNPLVTHMPVNLLKPSTIMCEQIQTINKFQLKHKIGELTDAEKEALDDKLKKSLGMVWAS